MSNSRSTTKKVQVPQWAESMAATFDPTSPFMVKTARLLYKGSTQKRARIYGKLSTMLENGIRLQVAIETLYKRAYRKSKTDSETIALWDILEHVKAGKGIGHAIAHYGNVTESMIIQAGEEGGDLPNALQQAAEILQAGKKMAKTFRKATIPPTVQLTVAIGILFGVGKYLIPQLAAASDPETWTGVAGSLYSFSVALQSPWSYLPVALIVFGLIASFVSLPFWKGPYRVYAEKLPPWSFYRLQVGTSWLYALATLLSNGVTQTDCIKQMIKASERKNPWLADRLKKTAFHIKSGNSLGPALAATQTEFPDPEIVDDLLVYSELDNFDEALFKIGRQWVDVGLEKMEMQAEILSGIIRNIVYAIIAWFAFGTIQIMNIMNSAASGI